MKKFIENKKLDAKNEITEESLLTSGLVNRRFDGVRILAKGKIDTKVKLVVTGASKAAIKAVEDAGGSISVSE